VEVSENLGQHQQAQVVKAVIIVAVMVVVVGQPAIFQMVLTE